MPLPSTGYAIPTIAALKAIASTDRANGYSMLVISGVDGLPCWYTYIADSTVVADDKYIFMPDDRPINGRWFKLNVQSDIYEKLILKLTIPPTTGADEIAIFADSADGKVKMRAPNNGAISEFGGTLEQYAFGNNETLDNNYKAGN